MGSTLNPDFEKGRETWRFLVVIPDFNQLEARA